MRIIFLIEVLLFSFLACKSQSKEDIVSREKADIVLSRFDSLQTPKLLFAISDEHYYLISKDSCGYKEYYVHTDSLSNVKEVRLLNNRHKRSQQLLSSAFNLNSYKGGFVTDIEKAKVVQGNKSYFVIKDNRGKRYVEYCLPVLTSPIPIDAKLYKYLTASLLRETVK